MIPIPALLSPDDLAHVGAHLDRANWGDGRATAGHQAVHVKRNLQLGLDDPIAADLGRLIVDRLGQSPLFIAAALPRRVLPPRFNRYEGGGTYGDHIDNALFRMPHSDEYLRTDLSCTLFLNEPDDYEGGTLVVVQDGSEQRVKMAAGDLILYPSTSLHRVEPVTKGKRIASFFWVQSLVRGLEQRQILLSMDHSIQQLSSDVPDHGAIAQLTGAYHNLLRLWSNP